MANIISENEMFFNQFEPKLANRFLMTIDGVPTYMVRATGRPSFVQERKVLPHINLERYVKGKTKWQEFTVTIYDAIVPSGEQIVMEWERLHHESLTGRDGYMDMYKKDIILHTLDPIGAMTSEWIAKGAMITAVNFGELDWNNDEPLNIQITISADFWVLSF